MLTEKQIDKLYSNNTAYEKYDILLNEIIHHIYEIKYNEKAERYEICKSIYEQVMNLIAFRSVEISRLLTIDSQIVFEHFMEDYNILKKEIEKNEQ